MDEDNVTKVNTSVCSYATCGLPAVKICSECGQDFCEEHECLMHSKSLDTKREPVLDEDGEPRRGERIALIGEGWPDRMRMVDDMSDDELIDYIGVHQRRLQKAMKDVDYEQVTIAHASYILGSRQHSRYIAAMRRRRKKEEAGNINLGKKKVTGGPQIPADIASMMKAFNITYDIAVKMKAILGAKKA